MVNLNEQLLKSRNVSEENEQRLIRKHEMLMEVFDLMNQLNPDETDDLLELKEYVKIVESIETLLQISWGFTVDEKFHSWWYRVPHCNCPKMDNDDYVGHKYRIYNGDCKLHYVKPTPDEDEKFKRKWQAFWKS